MKVKEIYEKSAYQSESSDLQSSYYICVKVLAKMPI